MITLYANRMTFRIDPDTWSHTNNKRLKAELDEFLRWFGSNVNGMSKADTDKGWALVKQFKEQLEARGLDTAEFMHLDSAVGGGGQISFFPTHI